MLLSLLLPCDACQLACDACCCFFLSGIANWASLATLGDRLLGLVLGSETVRNLLHQNRDAWCNWPGGRDRRQLLLLAGIIRGWPLGLATRWRRSWRSLATAGGRWPIGDPLEFLRPASWPAQSVLSNFGCVYRKPLDKTNFLLGLKNSWVLNDLWKISASSCFDFLIRQESKLIGISY